MENRSFLRQLAYLFDIRDSGVSTEELLQIGQGVTLGALGCTRLDLVEACAELTLLRSFPDASPTFDLGMHQDWIRLAASSRKVFVKSYDEQSCVYFQLLDQAESPRILVLTFAKDRAVDELFLCQMELFRQAIRGQKQVAIQSSVISSNDEVLSLNHRQRQIASLLVDGRTNREIAKKLEYSESTVRYEIIKMYERLRVRNRAQAAAALRNLNLVA